MIAELTQKEAARRAGMSIRRLSLIERGEIKLRPGTEEYDRLSRAMPWPERKPVDIENNRADQARVGDAR